MSPPNIRSVKPQEEIPHEVIYQLLSITIGFQSSRTMPMSKSLSKYMGFREGGTVQPLKQPTYLNENLRDLGSVPRSVTIDWRFSTYPCISPNALSSTNTLLESAILQYLNIICHQYAYSRDRDDDSLRFYPCTCISIAGTSCTAEQRRSTSRC